MALIRSAGFHGGVKGKFTKVGTLNPKPQRGLTMAYVFRASGSDLRTHWASALDQKTADARDS